MSAREERLSLSLSLSLSHTHTHSARTVGPVHLAKCVDPVIAVTCRHGLEMERPAHPERCESHYRGLPGTAGKRAIRSRQASHTQQARINYTAGKHESPTIGQEQETGLPNECSRNSRSGPSASTDAVSKRPRAPAVPEHGRGSWRGIVLTTPVPSGVACNRTLISYQSKQLTNSPTW